MTSVLLRASGIAAGYGESRVLFGIDFSLDNGGSLALLGRNGAGKTTTLRALMNLTPPSAGEALLDGASLRGRRPFEIAALGMTLVPEHRGVFRSLTVDEVLDVARDHSGGRGWSVERVFATFPRLAERRSQRMDRLSGGEQQMLAIGRALRTGPRLLLLDEPTQGLAPLVVESLLERLLEIKRQGIAIIVVEQNLAFAQALAEQVVVIGKGQVRWYGAMAELDLAGDLGRTWLGV